MRVRLIWAMNASNPGKPGSPGGQRLNRSGIGQAENQQKGYHREQNDKNKRIGVVPL